MSILSGLSNCHRCFRGKPPDLLCDEFVFQGNGLYSVIFAQPWDGATLAMLRTWLINLPLVPCVPAVMVVNVFWLSYLQ